MIAVFGILFIIAQGAAVFLTAFLGYRMLGTQSAFAKAGAMLVSYALWITFTYAAFFAGADSYIVFAGAVMTSAISSACFCAAWLAAPLMKSVRNV